MKNPKNSENSETSSAPEQQECINTYDQLMRWKQAGLTQRPVAICVAYTVGGRTQRRNGWDVYSPFESTDPNAHFMKYGRKHFGRDFRMANAREGQKSALAEAIAWANERYGPFEFVRNRMGDYVPKELNRLFPLRKSTFPPATY